MILVFLALSRDAFPPLAQVTICPARAQTPLTFILTSTPLKPYLTAMLFWPISTTILAIKL